MIVDQIKTTNFIGHRTRTLELPRRGVVLITGENGAGKSSFVEAVAYAMYGKTLRGTEPWQDNVAGDVTVHTPNLIVVRGQPKGGKPSLSWAHRDLTGKANEDTRSKAQTALDAHLPEFKVWRYGSVLSAGDTMQFTGATDADKKALIELMLNLETTEPAVRALREDLKAAEKALVAAEKALAVLEANIVGCEGRLADAAALQGVGVASSSAASSNAASDVPGMITSGQALNIEIEEAQAAHVGLEAQLQEARTTVAVLRRDIAANAAMSSLEGAACVTCGRALDASYHAHVTAAIGPVLEAQRAKEAALIASGRQTATAVAAAKERVDALTARRDKLRTDVRLAQDRARAATEAERIRVDAVAAKERLVVEREALQAQVRGLTEQIRISKLSEAVLSTQGIRSYLLGSALDSLTFMANVWMSRIARSDFRLTIKPYSETGFKNAISIDVAGAGGGQGYKAASTGERKRIDLAILLALGELSRRAHSEDVGTLWFDECFDGLDADGRAAIVRMLIELADQRCCVVISHHPDLIEMLKPHSVNVWLERQPLPASVRPTARK